MRTMNNVSENGYLTFISRSMQACYFATFDGHGTPGVNVLHEIIQRDDAMR